jgi:hypothetical protein
MQENRDLRGVSAGSPVPFLQIGLRNRIAESCRLAHGGREIGEVFPGRGEIASRVRFGSGATDSAAPLREACGFPDSGPEIPS